MKTRRWCCLVLLLVASAASAVEPELADVFVPDADGFASVRIPSVVVTCRGVVLAFAEGRAADSDQAKNKIILKRSTDGGRSWGKLAVVADGGDASLNNPCAVVERDTGRVLLMYQSYPPGVTERSDLIRPGHEGEFIVRSFLVTSADGGATWSEPREVTRETKRPQRATTLASGPGVGIQLRHGRHAGRILIPFNEGPWESWNVYAAYSDDRGRTWRMGDVVPGGLADDGKGGKVSTVNEAQLVELKDGSVRLNMRRWAGPHVRKASVSRDGGLTWSAVEDAPELRDPGCMASILRYTDPADGGRSRILFSGPQGDGREKGTVFLSYDEGATWPVRRVLVPGKFAYSCLVALPDGTIGCLYEADGTRKIAFARLTLDWLSGSTDRLEKVRR
jgi:sialidase-1